MSDLANKIGPFKPITLLLLISLLSCHQEAPLPKVASIDLLLSKSTSVSYGEYKVSNHVTFPTPDSISFLNATLYPTRITQTTYEYDDQKRIVKSQGVDLDSTHSTETGGGSAVTTYTYTAQTVTPHSDRYPLEPSRLNSEGYVANGNTYDQNGHRTNGAIILNDNISQVKSSNNLGFTSLVIYEYDLTKPNIPDPYQNLYGKPSYNLLVKKTLQSTYPTGGYKEITTYTYEYDQRGLPKRRTAYSEFFEIGTSASGIIKSPEKQVVISDFEFAR